MEQEFYIPKLGLVPICIRPVRPVADQYGGARTRSRYERKLEVFIQCWPSAAAGAGVALGGGAATMGPVGVWAI